MFLVKEDISLKPPTNDAFGYRLFTINFVADLSLSTDPFQ